MHINYSMKWFMRWAISKVKLYAFNPWKNFHPYVRFE